MILLLSALLLTGCDTTEPYSFIQCEVELILEATEGAPGAEITLSGGPLSDRMDTSVLVDGHPAEVLAIEREDCDACDTCLQEESCGACEPCLPCEEACAPCAQTGRFAVPDLPAGAVPLVLTNRFGSSAPQDFEVLAPEIP
ncbi:MAG: hypothetical protein JXX28_18530 [Deltaproteobacteria bacterium]|nr:hypothetical protein [Deltaproteobacteria bacterium]